MLVIIKDWKKQFKDIKLKRDMKQYIDVENFEDYELTDCLAYEMAIRNQTVFELIINFDNENQETSRYIDDKLFCDFYIGTEYYLNYHFFEYFIDLEEHNKENEEITTIFNPDNKTRSKVSENDDRRIFMGQNKGYIYRSEIIDNFMESNSIYPSFKRPKLQVYEISKEVDVSLNLALPEKDLIEFLKLIKKDFDKNNKIIQTAFEVSENVEFKNSDKIKPRDILSNKLYVADMFYIYDCIKLGYRYFDIRNELYRYYLDVKKIETRTMTEKTIKKYNDIAKEYIEKLKYKELVTGIKLDEIEKRKNLNYEMR